MLEKIQSIVRSKEVQPNAPQDLPASLSVEEMLEDLRLMHSDDVILHLNSFRCFSTTVSPPPSPQPASSEKVSVDEQQAKMSPKRKTLLNDLNRLSEIIDQLVDAEALLRGKERELQKVAEKSLENQRALDKATVTPAKVEKPAVASDDDDDLESLR